MLTTVITRRRVAAGLAGLVLPLAVVASAAGAHSPASGTTAAAAGAPTQPGFGDWPTWQGNQEGARYNPAEFALNPATARLLKLKWAYAFPAAPTVLAAKSQPAVVGNTVYFGGSDSKFRAVDAQTGRTKWSFDLQSVKPGPGVEVVDGPTVAGDQVFFGDSRAYVYGLDRRTGRLLWSRSEAQRAAIHTSSPLYYRGRVYIGTSSGDNTGGPESTCCTFRGHLDAIDARTGKLDWRYYTVPKAKRMGSWPSGAAKYGPSGAGVWSSPAVDPATDTLYVGTGENYTGSAGDYDSVLALNATTGAARWKKKMTKVDTWRSTCNGPNSEKYCPGLHDGTALDYDLGASPNIFHVGGQTRIGIGQKSGVYHVFDAHTGRIIWQRELSEPMPSGGLTGVQWGSSYDGRRLYVATYLSKPSTLYALDPATGKTIWRTNSPASGCTTGGAAAFKDCIPAFQTAVSSSPGLVYVGGTDGKLRVYSSFSGRPLWQYDTAREFRGVNGLTGHGSELSGGTGPVIAHGRVYAVSGYDGLTDGRHGYVLLSFGL